LLHDTEWQHRYERGYFLVLANHAFKNQPLEAAFTQCWTIWEHLFATMNRAWASDDALRNIHAADKIAFVLHTFALKPEIENADRERIRSLAAIRNRLVHHGRFPPNDTVYADAVLFVQITEFVVEKSLGLGPSNLFNTVERFDDFLAKNQTQKQGRISPKTRARVAGSGRGNNGGTTFNFNDFGSRSRQVLLFLLALSMRGALGHDG
jgi:hypothetical protein